MPSSRGVSSPRSAAYDDDAILSRFRSVSGSAVLDEILRERAAAIADIHASTLLLNEIARDLAGEVAAQQDHVDALEERMSSDTPSSTVAEAIVLGSWCESASQTAVDPGESARVPPGPNPPLLLATSVLRRAAHAACGAMPATNFDLTGLHDEHTVRAKVPPPLSELCVRVLAANFSSRPTLRGIAPRYINRVTELLPTSLPLEVTGPLVDDEGYWKRCSVERWDNCQISDHGSSWKRCFFERNLADFLEAFDPDKQDTEELTRTLAVSKDYVFSLRIKQFLSHLDMEMLFQNVPTLCNLDMTFGVKEIGMEYERSLFGMKLSDVTSLQKALKVTETLTILSLPCNLLDDNTVRVSKRMSEREL